jgi:hypothetical protein
MGRRKNDLQKNRSMSKLNPYFLESLKNALAKLDAKNEIVSAHPQSLTRHHSILNIQFPIAQSGFQWQSLSCEFQNHFLRATARTYENRFGT